MFTVEHLVGRFIEVRMKSPVTGKEVEDACARMDAILGSLSPRLGVIAGDYSMARVLPGELATRLLEVFRQNSPRIERSGLLISSDSAIPVLQMERLIRNAANPGRRTFREVHELKAFLHEVLTPRERTRLDVFFE